MYCAVEADHCNKLQVNRNIYQEKIEEDSGRFKSHYESIENILKYTSKPSGCPRRHIYRGAALGPQTDDLRKPDIFFSFLMTNYKNSPGTL